MAKNSRVNFLEDKGLKVKQIFLDLILNGFKFHLGGTASCLDLMVCLVYENFINYNKKNRNILMLSKGHALGGLFSILIEKKIFNIKNLIKLKKKNLIGNQLDIYNLKKFVDWNTGSLGHSLGVSIGLSMAYPKKKIWNIVGDGELDEGSIWEALHFISDKKIKNINIIIDRNKIAASSKIEKKVFFSENIFKKLKLNTQIIDGHNYKQIIKAFNKTKRKSESCVIIANTVKGKDFGKLENNLKYSHHLPSLNVIESLKNKLKKQK